MTVLATLARPERPYIRVDQFDFAPDVDPVAVERAVNGERPAVMTRAEKAAAAHVLDATGATDTEIGRTVGVTTATVRTWRVNDWDPAGQVPPPPRPVRAPAACGTYAGYHRHHNHHETPCDACVASARVYNRRRGLGPSGGSPAC